MGNMSKLARKNKRISRFFIEQPLAVSQELSLPANLVNYLVNVLRLASGDDIILFNGQQTTKGEFQATLTDVSKRKVSVKIREFNEKDLESPLKIHLFQGISRGDRMDITIQKAVELGVDTISPVFTQRSNTGKLNTRQLEKKHQHWQAIANSACEQCGRTQQVKVTDALELQQLDDYPAQLNLLLAPGADTRLSELKNLTPTNVNILIGPEGGLSEEEINQAVASGYKKIQLGKRILRTETAGLTAISVMQFLWGDLA